jgi:hypothetical protein
LSICTPEQAAENSEKQIPRRLKPPRDDKYKGLRRWPEGQLYPNGASQGVFQRPVKACSTLHAARVMETRNSMMACPRDRADIFGVPEGMSDVT